MPLARVGEIELSYERAGSGPPLLMIMGMSGTFDHWNADFLADLRRDFETIVYDHRGVGDSSRLEGQVTIAQLAQDAAGLLERAGDRLRARAGHLDGGDGRSGARARHPERIRTLALGCTYCGGEGSSAGRRRRHAAARRGDDVGRPRARAAHRLGGQRLARASPPTSRRTRAFGRSACSRAVRVPVIMAQMRAITAHDTSARLPEIALPTLVIHGTDRSDAAGRERRA